MKKHGFCKFSKNLYWGESIKKRALVKWRLFMGSGQLNIYCITGAAGDSDQLEITHCAFLKQKYYKKYPAFVYGIASGYNEALDIIVRISEEASRAGMDGKLKEYLQLSK